MEIVHGFGEGKRLASSLLQSTVETDEMIQAIQKIQSILWLQAAKHTENSFQKIVSR